MATESTVDRNNNSNRGDNAKEQSTLDIDKYRHKHDNLVAEHMGDTKVTHFGVDTPHAPPAVDNDNKYTLWIDEIDDKDRVESIAEACGYPRPDQMGLCLKVIRSDFREYYVCFVGREGAYELIVKDFEHKHLPDVSRFNEEVDYDGNVKDMRVSFDSGSEPDEDREEVDFATMLKEDSNSEDNDEETNDIDLSGLE